MALEHTLEDTARACLLNLGANPIKEGQEGRPDRLVLWGQGRHFWIEFKKAKTGRVRIAQKIYAKYLRGIGDEVHLIDDMKQLQDVITRWIAWYGMPTANRDKVFNP